MKKGMKFIALTVCAAVGFAAIAGCSVKEKQDEKVYLRAITGADAVGVIDADYFLLAEPAVTAQSKKGYSIAADLQSLYGGENGYPQAVLVAKASVAKYTGWLEHVFLRGVADSAAWLETASGAEVVSAISSHVADKDYATTLKAPLLTADVMARCGVWFSHAGDAEVQTEIKGFVSEILSVNDKATAMPADGFFWEGGKQVSAVIPPEEEVTVCMPDGAPAMALAGLMAADTEDDGITYKVMDTTLIASAVTNTDMDKNADMCVLPLTAACKLLGNKDGYTMVGVVTHGNLFLISKDGERLTAENLNTLKGKTIGVLKINEVPGLTLKVVLNKYNIPFEELKTV